MPSFPTTSGSIAVDLMTEPSGAMFPVGNVIVDVIPRLFAFAGLIMTSSASTPSASPLGAKNEHLFPVQSVWLPPHPHILTQTEQISAWPIQKHVACQRQ